MDQCLSCKYEFKPLVLTEKWEWACSACNPRSVHTKEILAQKNSRSLGILKGPRQGWRDTKKVHV